jgi:hypothetical protein
LTDGNQPVLNLLAPELTPAGAFEAMAVGRLGKASSMRWRRRGDRRAPRAGQDGQVSGSQPWHRLSPAAGALVSEILQLLVDCFLQIREVVGLDERRRPVPHVGDEPKDLLHACGDVAE